MRYVRKVVELKTGELHIFANGQVFKINHEWFGKDPIRINGDQVVCVTIDKIDRVELSVPTELFIKLSDNDCAGVRRKIKCRHIQYDEYNTYFGEMRAKETYIPVEFFNTRLKQLRKRNEVDSASITYSDEKSVVFMVPNDLFLLHAKRTVLE